MEHDFTYHSRPGSLPLSLLALAGLILLAVQLWEVIPGFVLLIFIPALLVSIAELILTPIYGVRMSDTEWRIENGRTAQALPTSQHRLPARAGSRHAAHDGRVVGRLGNRDAAGGAARSDHADPRSDQPRHPGAARLRRAFGGNPNR
jgi:hypothetical protein